MITLKLAKFFEIFGLTMVLASSFVQMFLLTSLEEISQESLQFRIENKIDILYAIGISNFQKLHPENRSVKTYHGPNAFERDYKYAEDKSDLKRISMQTSFTKYIIGFIFVIGSLLMLIGKIIETKVTMRDITKQSSQ